MCYYYSKNNYKMQQRKIIGWTLKERPDFTFEFPN